MMEKTPAQKLGLHDGNGQSKKHDIFLGFTWFLAWVFAVSGIGMAAIQFAMAGATWGREADGYVALGILGVISGFLGFVVCAGIAIIIENLTEIRESMKQRHD